MKLAMLLRERREPGVVVPMPRNPAPVKRAASVSVPLFKVENVRSPFPPLKFCWRMEAIAAVVVEMPEMSCVRNARPTDVVVADPLLTRLKAVVVAAEELDEVAAPLMVRPPALVPLPIVVDAVARMPVVKPMVVEVETPYPVVVNGNAAASPVGVM